jgi:hypothetical protein
MGALRPFDPLQGAAMKRLVPFVLASIALPAHAGILCGFPSFAIPALDDVGLVVLAVLVGGVAGWAARRRK